jgi:hypothetical protein
MERDRRMKTMIAIPFVAGLALLIAGNQPVAAQAVQVDPLGNCELHLSNPPNNWLREQDLAQINPDFRLIHLTPVDPENGVDLAQRTCNTRNNTVMLRCVRLITEWNDELDLTIKRFAEGKFCEILGASDPESACGNFEKLNASNVTLKLRPTPEGKIVDLFCVARRR